MSIKPLLSLVLLATGLIPLSPQVNAAKPEGTPYTFKTVENRELKLYVTKPKQWQASDQRPAIVFFHGGGWVGGAPGQFTEHSKYFASRGVVCFQVQYRLLDRSKSEPPTTCIEDAKSAMRWVRSRAKEFGIDANRIASGGGSAGGHLAAFVGTSEGVDSEKDNLLISPKSNAMLLFNPVYNNGPGGWGTARVKDDYKKFSPAHNLTPDDPPSIVFLGDQDKLIPVATAEEFRDTLRKHGVQSELRIFKDQGHGFFNHGRNNNQFYRETVIACDEFLQGLGWIEGPATISP